MKNEPILYGIIGLLAGVVIMLLTAQNAVNTNNTGMMRMMGIRQDTTLRCPMNDDDIIQDQQDTQGTGIR